jgi:hypothetical protein
MMWLSAALLALLIQATPASVSGVVLNADGEPIPNIRVTLGKTGVNLGLLERVLAAEKETTLSAESVGRVVAGLTGPQGALFGAPSEVTDARAIPVDDIHEITISPSGITSVVYNSSPPVMTDERGRFSFAAVGAGSYRLTFSGNGYVKQHSALMTLTNGQSKTDIVMRMLKLGAIGGQIRDSAGQAVTGVEVEAFRYTYDQTGQRRNQRVAVTRTDDLGEYRMYALLPGRYYVTAGGYAGRPEIGGRLPPGLVDRFYGEGYTTPNRIPQFYSQMYYPGAANQTSATAIDVPSGADVRGVDLLVSLLPSYRVRGRVVDARTGRPPQRVGLLLNYQDPGGKGSVDLLTGINPNYNPADGTFELQNISAGAYFLLGVVPDGPPQGRVGGWVPLNVVGDMDGVALSLAASGSLNGRVRVESGTPNLNLVQVQFYSRLDVPLPRELRQQSSPIAPNGTIRIDNMPPGEYRISISGIPEGFYLKEARVGETDVLNAPLRYSLADTAVLDVVISPKVGVIDGTALPGAQVVLIPNRNRERTELFRQVTADAAGRFAIPSIAPGEYTLAAWQTLEPYAFFDPSLIRQAEDQGKAVRVGESSRQTVDVTVIR